MIFGAWFNRRSKPERDDSPSFSSAASAFYAAFEICEPFTVRAGEAHENSTFLLARSELLSHAAAIERCESCIRDMKSTFEKSEQGSRSEPQSLKLVVQACQLHEIGLLQFNKICALTALAALQKTIKDTSLFIPKDYASERRKEDLERLSEEAQQMGQRTEASLEDIAVSRAFFQLLTDAQQ